MEYGRVLQLIAPGIVYSTCFHFASWQTDDENFVYKLKQSHFEREKHFDENEGFEDYDISLSNTFEGRLRGYRFATVSSKMIVPVKQISDKPVLMGQ